MVVCGVVEQAFLTFFVHPLRFHDGRRGRLDAHRRFLDHALPFLAHHFLALIQRSRPGLAIAPGLPGVHGMGESGLEGRTQFFREDDPRNPGEQAGTRAPGEQQQHRAAIETEHGLHQARQGIAQSATCAQGQLRAVVMKTQGFERTAAQQHQEKADQRQPQSVALLAFRVPQIAIPPPDHEQGQDDPPPGGVAEQVEQEIGSPGSEMPAAIGHGLIHPGARPARIAAVIGEQDHAEVDREAHGGQPPDLAQLPRGAGCEPGGFEDGAAPRSRLA